MSLLSASSAFICRSVGGGHKGAATGSSNYALPYGNLPETANAQINWRYCDKCHVMFFDGYPAKGRCAAGGGHNAQGFKFRLPHETRADAANQAGWRFCVKCSAMFWDAWAGKGSCPSGGGHAAAGFQFVLPLLPAPEFKRRSDVTTDGWAPIGGWTEVTLRPDGSCVFAGDIHNSGAINIRFTLGAVLITPSGQKLAFAMNNKRVDGTEVLVGRDRDYNWNEAGTFGEAAWAADNWSDLSRSTLHWKLVASSAVGSGVRSFLENIVIDVYNKLPGGEYKGLLIGKPLRLILSL